MKRKAEFLSMLSFRAWKASNSSGVQLPVGTRLLCGGFRREFIGDSSFPASQGERIRVCVWRRRRHGPGRPEKLQGGRLPCPSLKYTHSLVSSPTRLLPSRQNVRNTPKTATKSFWPTAECYVDIYGSWRQMDDVPANAARCRCDGKTDILVGGA